MSQIRQMTNSETKIMEHIDFSPEPARKPTIELIVNGLLWPGEAVRNLMNIQDPDSRVLFRMFINLSVYGKTSVLLTLILF